jgi:tripartite-type tricarboxylate transporter receptor subunit TctC
MLRRHLLAGAAAGALVPPRLTAPALAQPAPAPAWPAGRPVKVIYPGSPGSPADVYGRLLCEHFARSFGVPFVLENRAGGSGAIGSLLAGHAAPDGLTLLFTPNSFQVVAPLVIRNIGFDPARLFTPVANIYRYGMLLIAANRVPIADTAGFVAWARSRPGPVNMASVGIGSVGHLLADRFARRAGIETVHVPYRQNAMLSIVTGECDFIIDNIGNSGQLMREAKVRSLALTGPERSPLFPDLPLLSEVGYPGFLEEVWFGLFAPTGTPRPIVERLNEATNAWLALSDTAARFHRGAHTAVPGTPEDLARFWAADRAHWAQVVQETGISAEN